MYRFTIKKMAAALLLAGLAGSISSAGAQTTEPLRIGFLTDMSGAYSDITGMGGVEAVKMAIADFGGSVNGRKIELLTMDHLSKADLAANKAREWMDVQHADLIMAGANSAAYLAIAKVAADKKKLFIVPGTGTARLTNEECNPYTVHYGYDTVAMAKGIGAPMVAQGNKTWFFLTVDYTYGHSLEADTARAVKAAGGTVVGSVSHPLSAPDFSSFILQAQASKAQVLALANGGADSIAAIKAAEEFGISKTMKLVGLSLFITDIHALGLQLAQNIYLVDGWYWDQTPASRAWSKRYFEKMKKMPTAPQAAGYSATIQYLNAVKKLGSSADADKVLAEMKTVKINDMYTKGGYIRADNRMVHDMFLMQVKKPAESKYPWDYYKVVDTIPGEKAFTTKAESKCAAWK